ncbi:DUF3237 domain-containing protein [Polaromonas sp.]|uniref:DUF3237 domain-containing protein n=1 Tax=Polaromonas sp. TaxID=1869339 RepID=UPI0032631111
MNSLAAPPLIFFADLSVDVNKPQEVGDSGEGLRRLVPITGGQAKGQDWQARVLPGGTDFQLITAAGTARLDARYLLETDAGELIYVQNHAIRSGPPELMARLLRGEPVDPALVYFRCSPRFETTAPALRWVNERLFVGTGARLPDQVQMRFYEVG